MNTTEVREVLSRVRYRDWEPVLGTYTNGAFWLQWVFRRDGEGHRGQRWYVSNTLTRSELVRIAWQAVEAAELMSARQHFLYRNQPVFGDCDVDQLSDMLALHEAEPADGEEKKDD
jgi:hypothetical protein